MTQHVAVEGHLKTSWDDLVNPGDFMFDEGPKSLLFMCPCGGHKGEFEEPKTFIPLHGPRKWDWNGNREKPTISPSIRRLDTCKWHGHLVDGIFQPCSDSGC